MNLNFIKKTNIKSKRELNGFKARKELEAGLVCNCPGSGPGDQCQCLSDERVL